MHNTSMYSACTTIPAQEKQNSRNTQFLTTFSIVQDSSVSLEATCFTAFNKHRVVAFILTVGVFVPISAQAPSKCWAIKQSIQFHVLHCVT